MSSYFFYNEKSCDGYYKHKPETNKLVDKYCYGALSYVNKSLSFDGDVKKCLKYIHNIITSEKGFNFIKIRNINIIFF
jgi:hypothetical protein